MTEALLFLAVVLWAIAATLWALAYWLECRKLRQQAKQAKLSDYARALDARRRAAKWKT